MHQVERGGVAPDPGGEAGGEPGGGSATRTDSQQVRGHAVEHLGRKPLAVPAGEQLRLVPAPAELGALVQSDGQRTAATHLVIHECDHVEYAHPTSPARGGAAPSPATIAESSYMDNIA